MRCAKIGLKILKDDAKINVIYVNLSGKKKMVRTQSAGGLLQILARNEDSLQNVTEELIAANLAKEEELLEAAGGNINETMRRYRLNASIRIYSLEELKVYKQVAKEKFGITLSVAQENCLYQMLLQENLAKDSEIIKKQIREREMNARMEERDPLYIQATTDWQQYSNYLNTQKSVTNNVYQNGNQGR
ncbi:MAG: hypothetical protein J6W96_04115 [Alphaproteobacteria bacterium]|nr:hypothetical protein [Alphaproteobacteria bacterium]